VSDEPVPGRGKPSLSVNYENPRGRFPADNADGINVLFSLSGGSVDNFRD
jgi:hypothetical protein